MGMTGTHVGVRLAIGAGDTLDHSVSEMFWAEWRQPQPFVVLRSASGVGTDVAQRVVRCPGA